MEEHAVDAPPAHDPHDLQAALAALRSRVEELEARNAELERRLHAGSDDRDDATRRFVANAAHELRTPVAAITSAIEVLQSGAKDVVEERDRFLDHIEREARRLQRLGRALLLLARAEAAGERPRLTIVPLRPLLADVASAVTTAPSVTLSIRCAPGLAVLTAPDLIEQALVNVLANAARYTRGGRIVASAAAAGDEAVIRIRDTGVGMNTSETDSAFDRFYRAGRRDPEGFGLGLAIARGAIEAVGGTITLASAPGRGTTVTIRVPRAAEGAR